MRRTILVLLLTAATAHAIPTRISILKVAGQIRIDGDLTDSGWEKAIRVSEFVEYFRGDNQSPPARTTGYLTYDAQFVYVAFSADDPHPRDIRAPFVDRDKVLGDQDYVAVLIDTQNDRRSAVAFRVNPRGIQTDSVVNDANGVEDFSPDFFFEAVARQTPTGWSAEMRIPLSSLRYPESDPQTWGVILMRNYPRDYRYVMANTPIPKDSSCFVCHASELSGLYGLPSGGHLTLTPYATTQRDEQLERGRLAADPVESEEGIDVKWNPSTRLTVDATLNPDFSQLESDVARLDVNNRFALDYPEKRTFFLEGTDLLATPIRAVYTRTITAPAWGARATGQSGANAYTVLVADDRGGGTLILPGPQGSTSLPQDSRSRVLIGRVRRTFGDSFGAMLVSARETEDGGSNRIAGPDFLWKRGDTDRVSGQFLMSSTDGAGGHAGRVVFQRDAKRYDIWSAVSEYSPDFRADNGFVVQTGLRRGGLWAGLRTYPNGLLSYFRPFAGIERDVAYEGGAELRTGFYPGVEFRGKWGSDGWLQVNAESERVGSRLLGKRSVDFMLRAVPRRWMPAIQLNGIAGEKIDYAGARVGTGANVNLSGTIRPTDHLELQLKTTRDWLDLEGGRLYDARIDWLKLTYTFTARSLMRLIGQQSDVVQQIGPRDRNRSLSALYGYKVNWQTLFFVGYGDASITTGRNTLVRSARSVFMKVSYAFQR
ncbi:MAG TPA: DUF5916 domain-containing protein [Thermoanaerobaculia bacterium]|nr:DUF5916 domain-containing protein [Thermoanaerobaculia bacterium]